MLNNLRLTVVFGEWNISVFLVQYCGNRHLETNVKLCQYLYRMKLA